MSTETELKQNFKIKSKAKPFKALTSVLNVMTEEATINFTDYGIQTKMMDPSRKEMIIFNWSKDKFSQFELDLAGKDKISFSFFVSIVSGIFRRFSNEDEILLESTEKNTFLITNLTNNKKFDAKPIFEAKDTDNKPNVEYGEGFKIPISKFEEMIADSEVFRADMAWLESSDGKLIYKGTDDAGTATGVLIENFDQKIEDTAFRFEYIKPVMGALKPFVETELLVKLKESSPIFIDFEIGDNFVISYLLAPKTSRS